MPETLKDLGRFLEPSLLILVSLTDRPRHGYSMMEEVRRLAGVDLGPGTLYAALARLESRGLIEALPVEERRRPYRLTQAGERLLRRELREIARVTRLGLERLAAS